MRKLWWKACYECEETPKSSNEIAETTTEPEWEMTVEYHESSSNENEKTDGISIRTDNSQRGESRG